MFSDLLTRNLELPTKSNIFTQPYVDFLAHQFQLSHNGFHGIEHWFRVLINGRLIAAETGADLQVIEHFALLHDVMRIDEGTDINHGNRSADYATTLVGDWVHLDDHQLDQLNEACRYHSMGRLTRDITVQACWDADRLDLGRVGARPNPTYLGSRIARETKFLEAAFDRSKRSFVNYAFTR